ncbi:Pentatricopeptide repeat-containing protein [Platanthera guangdongensis]|uniref:Pentatricopeptide repeat-containing protein n=1 Tax=Platanthera guangdongensis TaxID=2320717 RepID=A0ABR2M014_9ASPA
MRRVTPSMPSLVSSQTLMILIRKYSNVHDIAKAISAFYSFKKSGLKAGLNVLTRVNPSPSLIHRFIPTSDIRATLHRFIEIF